MANGIIPRANGKKQKEGIYIDEKSLTLSNQAFLNKWRSGRDCYTEHQRAPGVTGRLALKQKANQLNYRSTFIYFYF